MGLIRSMRTTAALLATSSLFAACISENATAVDGTEPCTRVDCVSGGAAGRLVDSTAENGGTLGAGGAGGSGGGAPDGGEDIPIYMLVVDAPDDHTTVSGIVTVKGRAPGALNVEVWDSLHKHPPLVQTFPNADGTFETAVDTSILAPGDTAWTVFAWDSLPNLPYNHSASVTLHLTILQPP